MHPDNAPARLRETIVKLWFGLDAVVALAPPLYWAADGAVWPILGLPAALAYFLAVGACISASVVFALIVDRSVGERAA